MSNKIELVFNGLAPAREACRKAGDALAELALAETILNRLPAMIEQHGCHPRWTATGEYGGEVPEVCGCTSACTAIYCALRDLGILVPPKGIVKNRWTPRCK